MKIWIKTKLSDKPDASIDNPNLPDLSGHETKILNGTVLYSLIKPLSDGTIIVRLTGMPVDINAVKADAELGSTNMILLTDDEVLTEVRNKLVKNVSQLEIQRGNVTEFTPAENRERWTYHLCDCPDIEIDNILTKLGFNPNDIRRNKILREQEWTAIKKIAEHKGININDLELDIKKGRCDAHETALRRIREIISLNHV